MHKMHSEHFEKHPTLHKEYIDNLLWTARGLPNKDLQDSYVVLSCKLLEEQMKSDEHLTKHLIKIEEMQKEIDQLKTEAAIGQSVVQQAIALMRPLSAYLDADSSKRWTSCLHSRGDHFDSALKSEYERGHNNALLEVASS